MSYVLLAVHGMGSNVAPGWGAELTSYLDRLTEHYAAFAGRKLSQQVSIVPISYDDIFRDILDEWSEDARALEERARSVPDGGKLSGLAKWLQDSNGESFFWQNVVDVLLYRFFPREITEQVHAQVEFQIVSALDAANARAGGQLVYASVMAHSLGTAVTHDALARLGSEPLERDGETDDSWLARNGVRFRNLFMIANVGRVLQTRWKLYESCVHPSSQQDALERPYCDHYWNFRHVLDPFPAFCPFEPPVPWGRRLHRMEDLDHLAQFNVHAWTHYLAHPRVHATILRALFEDPDVVTDAEERLATAKFLEQSMPVCRQTVEAFTADVRALIASEPDPCDPRAFLQNGVRYLKRVQEAIDACL